MVDREVNGNIFSDGPNACGLLRSRFLDAGNEKISDNNVAIGRNTAPDGIFLCLDVDKKPAPNLLHQQELRGHRVPSQ
jgi:hypothetical protein